MDRNISIDILGDIAQVHNNIQLPLNFITVGEIENDDVKVYIKQDVYKRIELLANSDTSKELGSVLFGEYCESLNKTHLVISEFVEAKYTDASASTLTFTHETWDYIHSEHDSHFAQLRMLGWQHTHPNYGIFLSNYDIFIQENFFNMPFQVAYVIDPIQNIRGFFQWKDGKIEKLKGFYIYDDVGKPIKIEQTKKRGSTPEAAAWSKRTFIIMAALLAVFSITAAGLFLALDNRIERQLEQQNGLQNIIYEQAASIKMLQDTLTQSILDSDNTTQIEGLIEQIESQQIVLDNPEKVLSDLKGILEKTENDASFVVFAAYTVQRGDCLADICSDFDLDYQANIRIIKAMNGIENVNAIYVGQTIILPVLQSKD